MKYKIDIPIPNFLSLRFVVTIYALSVLYRINGNEIHLLESIGVIIFPAFFLGYTASVSPEYINIFQPRDTIKGKKPELGLINELKNLKRDQVRTLLIFSPIYLYLSYKLNKSLIDSVVNYLINKKKIKLSDNFKFFLKKSK